MFDEIDPNLVNLNTLLDAKIVLVLCDAQNPGDQPKMVGIVKHRRHWREAYAAMCSHVPSGKHAQVLLWELKGDAAVLAASEDIIKGECDDDS